MPDLVSPPKKLGRAGNALWNKIQEALIEQGTWKETDSELLESYVRSVLLAREAREKAADKPIEKGSQGQPVPSPWIKIARDAELDANRYAGDLILTPKARKQMQIAAASAKEDSDGDGDFF